jgi:hypothetical protein
VGGGRVFFGGDVGSWFVVCFVVVVVVVVVFVFVVVVVVVVDVVVLERMTQ